MAVVWEEEELDEKMRKLFPRSKIPVGGTFQSCEIWQHGFPQIASDYFWWLGIKVSEKGQDQRRWKPLGWIILLLSRQKCVQYEE